MLFGERKIHPALGSVKLNFGGYDDKPGNGVRLPRLFVLVPKLRLVTHQQRRLLLAESEDAKLELVVPLHYAAGAA